MNYVIKDCLYKFCVVYPDDVLIYSPSEDDHIRHISVILKRFEDVKLGINVSKYKFFQPKMRFLGLDVENGTIQILYIHLKEYKESSIFT